MNSFLNGYKKRKPALFSTLFLLLSLLFFTLSKTGLGDFDKNSDEYFNNSIKKAAIAYASVRGINSIVSVIKESNLDLAPAGVGLSVAAGQVLDPLDDMTERVSDVLVMAIVALGIEKVFFELISGFGFTLMAILSLVIAVIPLISKNDTSTRAYHFLFKGLVFILLLRLLLPISANISTYFYDSLLSERVVAAKTVLDGISKKEISLDISTEDDSFWDKVKNGYTSVKIKAQEISEVFNNIKERMGDIITALIELATIYIFAFILEIILIPVGVFLFIFKGMKVFFRYEL